MVETLVCVDDHRDDFDVVDGTITVSIVGIQDASGHVLGSLAVSQSRVYEDRVICLYLAGCAVAAILLVETLLHSI